MWIGDGVSSGFRSTVCGVGAALGVVGLGVSLSGCPVAAELENPERFDALGQSGPVPCDQSLPDVGTFGCDYVTYIGKHCASGGCHNQSFSAAGLDLTADSLLIARILEVPANHEITCPAGAGLCNLSMPQCEDCTMCPPTGDKLLTKTDFENGSWLIRKMAEFNVDTPNTRIPMGCGYAMPLAPGNISYTAERRDCLKNLFRWIADNGRPCSIPRGGSGGGGGGGTGGAGGAGSGGMGGT